LDSFQYCQIIWQIVEKFKIIYNICHLLTLVPPEVVKLQPPCQSQQNDQSEGHGKADGEAEMGNGRVRNLRTRVGGTKLCPGHKHETNKNSK
jgi:hypothetical protein